MSRYNDTTHDDLVQQMRDIVTRLKALEAPAGVPGTFGTINAVPYTEVTTPPVVVTSSTYVPTYRLFYRKRSNLLQVKVQYLTDPGTVGTIRLNVFTFSGYVPVGTPFELPADSSGTVDLVGDTSGLGDIGVTDMEVDVEARRDLGSGNIRILVAQAYG